MKKEISMMCLLAFAGAPVSLLAANKEQKVHVVRSADITVGDVFFRCACLAVGVVAFNATLGCAGTSLGSGVGALVCTVGATVEPPLIIPAIGLGVTSICAGLGAYFCGQFTYSCFGAAFNRHTVVVVADQLCDNQ